VGGEIPVTQFGGHLSLKWLVVLLLGTAASAYGTLATNGVTVRRAHNSIRLWSESLANQQLTYIAFFFSLLAAFDFTEDYKNLCFLEILFCLGFFICGLLNIRKHDEYIFADHETCDEKCASPLKWSTRWHILGVNTLLSIPSLLFALCLVLFLQAGRRS